MAQSRLYTLGKFSLKLEDTTAPSLATQKSRALLAYLIARQTSDVGRERILELLWPDVDPDRAKEGLRSALWSIRRAIRDAGFEPDEYLTANRAVVRWNSQTWLDSEEFIKFSQNDHPSQLESALGLYKGDFLEGDYEEWTVAERARLSAAYESVLSRLVRIARSHDAAQLLLGLNPYDEPSYILLIEDELSSGRVVAAEALAERCERALAEVGAQPSASLRQLISGISSRHIQAIPKLVLPFVGRETELASVRDCLVDESSTKSAYLISGEPGIGKSAFLSHAGDVARSIGRSVISVRCFEGEMRPFGPFEELYADLYDEPLTLPSATDNVDAALRLSDAIASGLAAESMVLVDDAHTLAPDALRVLSALASRLCARGHVSLIAARTEGVQPVALALAGCSLTAITLGPLQLGELRTAIDAVVADNQEKIAVTVFGRSGGQPLFARTLIESMAQAGLLRSDKGMWRLVGTLDDRVALPTSLTSYIQARLRARGEAASAVAAALALEPHATADDIIAALQLPEAKVFDALDDLLALGVVVQPTSGPQLAFAHDLYREVAAASLNVGRRSRLHRAFAERFAQSRGANSAAQQARHLSLAGEAAGAAETYCRAAAQALERSAWMEARDRCNAGIACLEKIEHTPDTEALVARLKVLSARAQAALGDSSSALASASDAMTIAKRSGESHTIIQAALARQGAYLDAYDASAALASAHETIAMARNARDDVALSIALADESWAHRLLAAESEATRAAEEAERIANGVGDPDLACYALEQYILAKVTWWRFSDGVNAAARLARAIAAAGVSAKIGALCARAALSLSLALREDASSDLAACDALLHEDIQGAKRVIAQSPFGPARLRLALGALGVRLALDRGLHEQALSAVEELERMTAPRAHALAHLFCADALFELGKPNSTAGNGSASTAQPSGLFMQDVFSGSRTPTAAEALNATTTRTADLSERLTRALEAIEIASRRTPLDCERAFAQLAHAADLGAAQHVAVRARLRGNSYQDQWAVARSAATSLGRPASNVR